MSKHLPKYQSVDRTELNLRIEELIKVCDDIRKVFSTPVSQISSERKMFMLQDLDEYESYLIRLIAKLKGVMEFSEN